VDCQLCLTLSSLQASQTVYCHSLQVHSILRLFHRRYEVAETFFKNQILYIVLCVVHSSLNLKTFKNNCDPGIRQ
jgi:hypothetical protein